MTDDPTTHKDYVGHATLMTSSPTRNGIVRFISYEGGNVRIETPDMGLAEVATLLQSLLLVTMQALEQVELTMSAGGPLQ